MEISLLLLFLLLMLMWSQTMSAQDNQQWFRQVSSWTECLPDDAQGSYGLVCLTLQTFTQARHVAMLREHLRGWDKWTGQLWSKVYTINGINAGFRRVNVSVFLRAEQRHNNYVHFENRCQVVWGQTCLCLF